jgi:hypothetical protein
MAEKSTSVSHRFSPTPTDHPVVVAAPQEVALQEEVEMEETDRPAVDMDPQVVVVLLQAEEVLPLEDHTPDPGASIGTKGQQVVVVVDHQEVEVEEVGDQVVLI